MDSLKILDCTLRDGGYVNDWMWGYRCAREIIRSLVLARIDVVEVGFLRNVEIYDKNITVCNDIDELNKLLPEDRGQTMFAAMAMRSNYDIRKLKPYSGDGIELIRITAHDYDLREGLDFAREVKARGYKLSINPINIMGYSDEEILWILQRVNEIQPYQFSIVDTFGSMKRRDLERIVSLVDNNLDRGIRVALHLHENMSLSTSLAQCFVDMHLRRPTAIDASLMGMGRDPGNLPIELIADYLNDYAYKTYDIDPMMDAIEEYIMPLKGKTEWGYTPAYFLSARFNLHRNYAEHYLKKGDLTNRDINHILSRFEPAKKTVFDASYADRLYEEYKNNTVDDSAARTCLKKELQGKKILIVAPGRSIVDYEEKIKSVIRKEEPVVISVNFIPPHFRTDYAFYSNNKRLNRMGQASCKTIVTSNLPSEGADHVIDHNSLCGAFLEGCNSLIMLLKLLKSLDTAGIMVAGADGYAANSKNYYDDSINSGAEHSSRFNDAVADAIERLDVAIEFVTPSAYARSEDKTYKPIGGAAGVPQRYRAVFFDLDGTLLDTSEGTFKAIDCIAEKYGLPMLPMEEKRTFIGPAIHDSLRCHYGLSERQSWELGNMWRDIYKDRFLFDAIPYAGIFDLLRFCREHGIKTGVATNKREDYTRTLLDRFGFTPLFDCVVGGDMDGKRTKADLIRICMERTGVTDPEKCLMVGDTQGDRNGAEQAGVGFLGVTYGFGFTKSTAAEFPLADNCEEMKDYIIGRSRAMNVNVVKNPSGGGTSIT